jgi:hypothetical protein
MKPIQRISFRFAVNTLLLLLAGVLVFHMLVLTGVLPFQIVWGGRLENQEQMQAFELVSIAINLLIIMAVLMKGGYLQSFLPSKMINFILWLLVGLFALNTVGNAFSKNVFEAIVFTPLTLLFAILLSRLAIQEQKLANH